MSDMSKVEQGGSGETKLRLEFPPIPPPKKITEGDIHIAVEDVITKSQEQRKSSSQTEISLTPTANAIVESADATTLSRLTRLKNLVPGKARKILKPSAQKAAATAAGLYILISSGCGNVESPSITPRSTPEPTPVSTSIEQTVGHFVEDNEGTPVKYVSSDGKEVFFDKDDINEIRAKAIALNELEILTVIPIENKAAIDVKFNYSKEKPQTLKLPKDVLPEEELKKRGVEIIQADNTNLYIREGVFAEGGPLESFNKAGSNNLTIVLIDGPVVSPYFMSDPKYEEVKKRLPKEIQEEESIGQYREKRVKEQEIQVGYFVQNEKELAKKIGALQNPSQYLLDDLSNAKKQILLHKILAYMYKNILTDKDIRVEMAFFSISSDKAGAYQVKYGQNSMFTLGGARSDVFSIEDATIFLAVGNAEDQKYNVVYFTPEGRVANYVYTFGFSEDSKPLSSQTHPNPKDFKIHSSASPDNPKSYPYAGQTPGFSLKHELEHDVEAREKWIEKGEIPDKNEYNIDMRAMEGIKEAWEKWEKSGFTDNGGYYFVFSLPEGGYILTKHESSDSAASSTPTV